MILPLMRLTRIDVRAGHVDRAMPCTSWDAIFLWTEIVVAWRQNLHQWDSRSRWVIVVAALLIKGLLVGLLRLMILFTRGDAFRDGTPSLSWFLLVIVLGFLSMAFHVPEKYITARINCRFPRLV